VSAPRKDRGPRGDLPLFYSKHENGVLNVTLTKAGTLCFARDVPHRERPGTTHRIVFFLAPDELEGVRKALAESREVAQVERLAKVGERGGR
jgi:hypothetical protein